ncbi:MAG TPA: glycosyltransferase family 9 protein [Candidatus Limnocylindrales bacterium]|nr:glycosyltransferase family 9 protein [Candidatus Limnocylindrales bacterium]
MLDLVHRPAVPQLDLSSARRLLVVRLDNIGDVVMTGPALRAIRASAPRAALTLLCSPAGRRAAALLPGVDDTIEARVAWQDVGGLRFDPERELALVRRLESGRFDAAFVFTSFSQSVFPPAFACYLAGIPVRVGQAADFGGSVLSHPVAPAPDGSHQVDRNLRLVEGLGIPAPDRRLAVRIEPGAAARASRLLARVGVAPDEPFVAIAPGASARARRYPAARYGLVAAELASALGWPIVVVGGDRDLEDAARILAAAPRARSLAGETSIPEWAAVIRAARLVVTSHSAPLHLADAVRTPVVCLFSGTDRESEWRPRDTPAVLLREPTACAPCRLFDCPIGLPCLDVEPAAVVEAGLSLLGHIPHGAKRSAAAIPPSSALEDSWTASAY